MIHERAIGVADGVGMWAEYGIDSGKFATSLMEKCKNLIHEYDEYENKSLMNNMKKMINKKEFKNITSQSTILPGKIIKMAFPKVSDPGSSTALLCILNGNTLNFYNIGDSKLMILELDQGNFKKIFESKEMIHSFNQPYQLTMIPNKNISKEIISSKVPKEVKKSNKEVIFKLAYLDKPDDGFSSELVLNENNIIILGTDGLFDNLYNEEIINIVTKFFLNHSMKDDLNFLAHELAKAAKSKSRNDSANCPFNDNAKKSEEKEFTGGKEDDITVIVSSIIVKKYFGLKSNNF